MKEKCKNMNSGPSSRKGEPYAGADTIPEMVPSTERKGGSPANMKKIRRNKKEIRRNMKKNVILLKIQRKNE